MYFFLNACYLQTCTKNALSFFFLRNKVLRINIGLQYASTGFSILKLDKFVYEKASFQRLTVTMILKFIILGCGQDFATQAARLDIVLR